MSRCSAFCALVVHFFACSLYVCCVTIRRQSIRQARFSVETWPPTSSHCPTSRRLSRNSERATNSSSHRSRLSIAFSSPLPAIYPSVILLYMCVTHQLQLSHPSSLFFNHFHPILRILFDNGSVALGACLCLQLPVILHLQASVHAHAHAHVHVDQPRARCLHPPPLVLLPPYAAWPSS